jgi:hypothetical protein
MVFLSLVACGKKGPPFLTERAMALRVDRLSATIEDGTFVLKGKVVSPSGQKEKLSDVLGCRVHYAWYDPKDPLCDGCPVEYQGFEEIKGAVVAEDRFHCRISRQKRMGTWFFEVRLMGPRQTIGPPSNRAKVIVVDG